MTCSNCGRNLQRHPGFWVAAAAGVVAGPAGLAVLVMSSADLTTYGLVILLGFIGLLALAIATRRLLPALIGSIIGLILPIAVVLTFAPFSDEVSDENLGKGLLMTAFAVLGIPFGGITGIGLSLVSEQFWISMGRRKPGVCPACRGSGNRFGQPGLSCNVCGGLGRVGRADQR